MRTVQAQGGMVRIARAGDMLYEGRDAKIACLGMNDVPGQTMAGSVNDRSLAVRLQYKRRSFLFP